MAAVGQGTTSLGIKGELREVVRGCWRALGWVDGEGERNEEKERERKGGTSDTRSIRLGQRDQVLQFARTRDLFCFAELRSDRVPSLNVLLTVQQDEELVAQVGWCQPTSEEGLHSPECGQPCCTGLFQSLSSLQCTRAVNCRDRASLCLAFVVRTSSRAWHRSR